MPYHVARSSECPASKPWACIKTSDGKIMGCHDSEASAMDQMKALYANEKSSLPFSVEWRSNNDGFIHAKTEFRLKPGVKPMLFGHAAVFDQLSEELGFYDTFREIIRHGAFSETIKNADVHALFNHDANYPLARTKAGTLRLAEDAIGLAVEIDMPETTYGRNIMISVERGDVSQMSFAFSVPKGGDNWLENGKLRELKAVNLYDVSPVVHPAYPQTDIGIARDAAVRAELRDLFNKVRKETEDPALTDAAELRRRSDARRKLMDEAKKVEPFSYQEAIRAARKTSY